MAKVYHLKLGERKFRLACPECNTSWSTMDVPSYCPECSVLVTFRTVKYSNREIRRADGEAKKLAKQFSFVNKTPPT